MPLSTNVKVSTKGMCKDGEISLFPRGAKTVWRTYHQACGRTGREWGLSGAEFISIITSSCYYCGDAAGNEIVVCGERFRYNGIDRINNEEGYEITNVVPCCKVCNSMKGDLTREEFFKYIKKILDYNRDEVIDSAVEVGQQLSLFGGG